MSEKNTSVILTEEGINLIRQLFDHHFCTSTIKFKLNLNTLNVKNIEYEPFKY